MRYDICAAHRVRCQAVCDVDGDGEGDFGDCDGAGMAGRLAGRQAA